MAKKKTEPRRHGAATIVLLVLAILLAIAVVVLAVLYGIERHKDRSGMKPLRLDTFSPADVVPNAESNLAAATVILAKYFSPPSDREAETKVAYNAKDNHEVCIRTKMGSSWRNAVQCVQDTHAKSRTPLTMLDWIGGPSIYFFTSDNMLTGIDHVPKNDTWRISSVVNHKIRVHDRSQIASGTRMNGTSAWIFYQDRDEQIREFGIDDFRDENWHDGSIGSLSKAKVGSGIGVSRSVNGTDEVLELFFQATNGGINGRRYAQSSGWGTDIYHIDGTSRDNVPDGASITATSSNNFDNSTDNMVLLAYTADKSFVNVQTRGTTNIPGYGAFSPPNRAFNGAGQTKGLAAVNSTGPRIYLIDAQKIKEVSSNDPTTSNWAVTDL